MIEYSNIKRRSEVKNERLILDRILVLDACYDNYIRLRYLYGEINNARTKEALNVHTKKGGSSPCNKVFVLRLDCQRF